MRTADTVLSIIRERGKRGLPLRRVQHLLYNENLYLRAYAKLYPNKGAMTKGITDETVDGMSSRKIGSPLFLILVVNSEQGLDRGCEHRGKRTSPLF